MPYVDLPQELAAWLVEHGYSNVFVDWMGDNPIDVIAIYEYPFAGNGTDYGNESRAIQCRARRSTREEAYAVCAEIRNAWNRGGNEVALQLSSCTVVGSPRSTIAKIDEDARGNVTASFNYLFSVPTFTQ